MRINRTPEEWHTLFDEQQRSGLNKTQFCRLHGITRSAFSNARHRLSASNIPVASFVPALPPGPVDNTPAPSDTRSDNAPTLRETLKPVSQAERQLSLMLPGATLSLPVDISPRWLASLLREMTP
ncbi:hypothetical protein IFY05_003171 [Salmonella enterica]|nr:hypothetical protein [Salmonella enterica]